MEDARPFNDRVVRDIMGLMEYHTIYARTAKPTYAQQKCLQERR